jgi:hypothetical protein
MQIKTTMRCHLLPVWAMCIKKPKDNGIGEDIEKLIPLNIVSGNAK